MNLLDKLMRCRAAAVLAVALLAACGGSRIDPFEPGRLIVFGDENSVLDDTGTLGLGSAQGNGVNFSVNGLSSDGTKVDCSARPIWTQVVASAFGLVFSQCNPGNVASPSNLNYAVAGSKAAGLAAQVDAHLQAGGFKANDGVLVMIGANDILEQFDRYPAVPEADLTAAVAAAGAEVANQVNRIARAGGKVIVLTVIDMGLTPYALVKLNGGAVATRLSAAFNERLRAGIINNGKLIGLVVSDELLQSMVKFPTNYGLADVTTAVCTTAAPACTTKTLITNGNADTWLWADSTHLGVIGHRQIGAAAVTRAQNNPF